MAATAFVLGDAAQAAGVSPVLARCIGALVTSAVLTLLFGRFMIPWLRRREVLEQVQKTDSPVLAEQHRAKRGTPTMGGLIFIPAILIATIVFADLTTPMVPLSLSVMLALAALGWRDDHVKLRSRRKHGLSKRRKFRVQLAISMVAAISLWALARAGGPGGMTLEVPFLGSSGIDLGIAGGVPFVAFAVFLLTASTNGVNLTDGLDGLAAGCVMLAFIPFAVLGFIGGHPDLAHAVTATFVPGAGEIAVFAAATIGGCVGFLWFNCHPARIFMGDTGALALGGALGMTALAVRQELLLVVVGGIFVIETLSVILQVFSFRVFGKRIFRIAPIHHHFQFGGWSESVVTTRFWIVAAALAVASLVTLPWQ